MNIKTITTACAALGVTVLSASVIAVVQPATASAQDKDDKKDAETSQADQNQPQASSENSGNNVEYIYVAQPGDTYSEMARKAVQTYGKKYDVTLSLAQILYAETNLTQEAGSPLLQQGQTVTIREATVRSWIQKAQKLDAATIALWNAYVPGVDFNTDDVGQN